MQTEPMLVLLILLGSCSALVKLPITRSTTVARKNLTLLDDLTLKDLKPAAKAKLLARNELPLSTYGKEFSFDMSIGTPPQQFSIVLDTAGLETSDFWVTSVACDPLYAQCKGHRQCDHRKSKTWNSSGIGFTTSRGTKGLLSTDTMNLGPLQVELQEFGEGWDFPAVTWHADGHYSFDPVQHVDTGITLFYNMAKQGLLPEPVVGMYLVHGNTSRGGELFLGGRDSSHYQGQLAYTGTTNNGWQVKMDSLKVPAINGSYCVGGCQALLANQDPYTFGPYKDAINFNKALGATLYQLYTYTIIFQFDCKTVSSLPNIIATIAGKDFVIGPEHYVVNTTESDGSTSCVSSIAGVNFDQGGYDWSLGSAIFEVAYIEFNLQNNQVGLAPSVY